MGIKINYNMCDQKYISRIVKNSETGRKYLQVTCPFCPTLTFDKREFPDHLMKTHGKRKDMVLARLFGHQSYPVLCTDCKHEIHFDEVTGTFPKKCSNCMKKDGSLKEEDESVEALKKERENGRLAYEQYLAKMDEKIRNAEIREEWKKLDIYSTKPEFNPEAAKFLRKVSYELRTCVVNGRQDKEKAFGILNYIDTYIDSELWKSDESDVTETSNKEGSSD